MPEKALVTMKTGEEHVLTAQPYDQFTSKLAAIPGPWTNVHVVYCSWDLEKFLRKKWYDSLPLDSEQRVTLKGLGDLPLEKAAALHARLDTMMETPHVPSVHSIDGPLGPSGGDPFC